MVPASSAQREPSMEEILASIRRIIEDNDTGRKPPEDGETMRHSQEITRGGSIPNGESSVIEVDAFRAELRGAASAEPVDQRPSSRVEIFAARPQAPVVEKKPTLAELQAQIAAETRSAPGAPARAARESASPDLRPAQRPASPEPAPAAAEPNPVEQTEAPRPVAAARTEAASEEKPMMNTTPAVSRPAERPSPKPAGIISERAERQVAAAFGELSEAFAARAQKTFDEMAEDMMRPMLRDWLDNNLPVLVERLVREEIERVARGA